MNTEAMCGGLTKTGPSILTFLAPWPYPKNTPEEDEKGLELDFEGTIASVGGVVYKLSAEQEERLPEGIVFYHDPQVFVGYVWGLFNPEKEIKP